MYYDRYITKQSITVNVEDMNPYHKNYINSFNMLIRDLIFNMGRFISSHPNIEEMYNRFEIPKASGGKRTISAPEGELKAMQEEIFHRLSNFGIYAHDAAYAYVKERDCRKAIERHQANHSNWFLKLDIKDFFPNCNRRTIQRMLAQLYPFCNLEPELYERFIYYLCKIALLDGGLPQGSPLSPFLTNLIMVPFDHALTHYVYRQENIMIYTRYADDILISCRQGFNWTELQEQIDTMLTVEYGAFKIKKEKTRYGSKAGRNWNLGIMYNKDYELTVGHKRKHMIKSAVHNWIKSEEKDIHATQVLQGELSYVHSIEPEYYKHLIKYINKKYNIDIIKEIKLVLK